jgi:integrase
MQPIAYTLSFQNSKDLLLCRCMLKRVTPVLQEITISAVFPEERYARNGSPLKFDIKGRGATLSLAVSHGLDALLERKELRGTKPGVIQLEVKTEHAQPIASKPQVSAFRGPQQIKTGHRMIQTQHPKEIIRAFEDYPRQATTLLAQRTPETDDRITNNSTPASRSISTFEDFAARWQKLVLVNHKPSSRNSAGAIVRGALVPFFGAMDLNAIHPEAVQSFVQSLQVKPKTIRNIIGVLRMVLKTARSWGYLTHDPLAGIVFPKMTKPHRPFFKTDEVQAILAKAEEPFKTLFWVLAETGMRGGEICGLRVSDLDLEQGIISVQQSSWRGRIQTPKTENAIRRFALSDALCEQLRRYLATIWKKNDLDLLFTTKFGHAFDGRNIVKWKLQPILKVLNIPRCGLHAFRHTSATLMDSMQVPLRVRTDRLGHSDALLTLNTYTHAIPAEDRRIANQIGELFRPTQSQSILPRDIATTAQKTFWLPVKR